MPELAWPGGGGGVNRLSKCQNTPHILGLISVFNMSTQSST